jgi:hypothetical protein
VSQTLQHFHLCAKIVLNGSDAKLSIEQPREYLLVARPHILNVLVIPFRLDLVGCGSDDPDAGIGAASRKGVREPFGQPFHGKEIWIVSDIANKKEFSAARVPPSIWARI